ncbi:MAG: vitamin K epoxide reductase family protein [Planctomycetaceae bacterium]
MTISPTFVLPPGRKLLWLMRVLCIVAMGISGYLAWTALNMQPVYGCGGGEVFDCSHVLNSRFSKIFGVPVSVPAFGLYASLLAVLFFMKMESGSRLLQFGWAFLTFGGLSAGLAALWFTGVQVFELKHLCPYCLGAHFCGLILAVIVIRANPLGWFRTCQCGGLAVLGIAALTAGQMLAAPPQTFTVETYDTPAVQNPEAHLTGLNYSDSEFAPPIEFEAPGEFSAPDVFAPPVMAPPVIAPPETAPAAAVTPPAEEKTSAQPPVAQRSDVPHENRNAAAPQPEPKDVTPKENVSAIEVQPAGLQTSKTRETPEQPKVSFPGVAYLFFPSTSKIAARLLTEFPDDPAPVEQTTSDSEKTPAQPAANQPADKPAESPAPVQRLVPVAGNRFSLNPVQWPLLGSPDARYVFVEMFDYTCPHCRHTNKAIEGAFDKYGSELAVIALPVPLERSCNDAASGSGHPGACELARLAVAVWRCNPSQFREFHHWMFEGSRTQSEARTKAEQLVGREVLTAELALPHASAYVAKHVELYKRVGRGAVPKLMFPGSTMTGQVSSPTTLVSAIERELASKPAQ